MTIETTTGYYAVIVSAQNLPEALLPPKIQPLTFKADPDNDTVLHGIQMPCAFGLAFGEDILDYGYKGDWLLLNTGKCAMTPHVKVLSNEDVHGKFNIHPTLQAEEGACIHA